MDFCVTHNHSRFGVSLRYWFFHLVLSRPTLLLSVGVYSRANLGMSGTFFINKSRVHVKHNPQSYCSNFIYLIR